VLRLDLASTDRLSAHEFIFRGNHKRLTRLIGLKRQHSWPLLLCCPRNILQWLLSFESDQKSLPGVILSKLDAFARMSSGILICNVDFAGYILHGRHDSLY